MTLNIGHNFNGKRIVKPGAYSMIDASGLSTHNENSEKKIVFIGSSKGGKPGTYLEFGNYTDAKNVLRGGDLLTAGELAWVPDNVGLGAGDIGFIRVNNGTRGSVTSGGLTLTSYFYGVEANEIQVKLEDGTDTNSKRLTVYFWPEGIREVYDNLGLSFNVKYTGSSEYSSLTITADENGKANNLKLEVGTDSSHSTIVAEFNLGENSEFSYINTLVNSINNLPDFTASVINTTGSSRTPFTEDLDVITDASVLGDGTTVSSLKGDILYNINSYSQLVEAEFTSGIIGNFNFINLSGGTDGNVPSSWATYLDLIIGHGCYIVVPLTTDEVIQAEVQQFINNRSNSEGDEMRAFYGAEREEPIDRVIKRAQNLNSSRATVVYPAPNRNTNSSSTNELEGYFSPAILAGKISGLAIGEPATFDYLNLIGLSKVLSSTEIRKLLESGVTPIEFVRSKNRSGFRVSQCITTYQNDDNPAYRENSIGEISDFLNMELREYLETRFVGTKATAVTPSLIKNAVQSFLDDKVRTEWLVEYDPNSVTVVDGDVIRVNYSAMPAFSINYIFVTGTFYRSTLTA